MSRARDDHAADPPRRAATDQRELSFGAARATASPLGTLLGNGRPSLRLTCAPLRCCKVRKDYPVHLSSRPGPELPCQAQFYLEPREALVPCGHDFRQ